MKCTPVEFEIDGQKVHAIVCGSRPKPRPCNACGAKAARLCDWKVPEGGTCDRPLCLAHASQPAPGKDLCPEHAAAWAARLAAGRDRG